jgi:hypothetical protein
MPADLLVAFAQHADGGSVDAAAWLEARVAALLQVRGVVAARRFTVNVVLGERTPAFYPALVLCELDGAGYDPAAAASAALDVSASDGLRVAAWEGVSIGVRRELSLPEHLYLQFSADPASMSFEEYSDWYQVHQDENIAQSPVLRRGWRYRLERLGADAQPGPTHLALYELDGALETLTADLGRAMAAGVISLPDWFTRFASLEGIAVGARATA